MENCDYDEMPTKGGSKKVTRGGKKSRKGKKKKSRKKVSK